MTEAEWCAFLEDRGLDRRTMADEFLLYCFFERHPVVGGEDVFRRSGLLCGKGMASLAARALCIAGAPFDGGDPEG